MTQQQLYPAILRGKTLKKYLITKDGRVWSKSHNKFMSTHTIKGIPYPRLGLIIKGIRREYLVHEVMANTFLGNRPVGFEIDHINGDPNDNRIKNLRYIEKRSHILKDMAKINYEIAKQIRADSRSTRAIAIDYEVSQTLVQKIKAYHIWRPQYWEATSIGHTHKKIK